MAKSIQKAVIMGNRFVSPEELADFFVFLCSPRSSYCIGATYYVDGGWLNTVA